MKVRRESRDSRDSQSLMFSEEDMLVLKVRSRRKS